MPSQPEVRWSPLKIGTVMLVSIATLMVLLYIITSVSGLSLFSHKLTVTSYYDNSLGLKPGAPVNLEGKTIGTVKTITLVTTPEHKATPVQVVMKLDPRYAADLHTDSTTTLTVEGVMGDPLIDISSQFAVGPPLQDGDELKTINTPSLAGVKADSQATIETLRTTLLRMDVVVDMMQHGKGTVGQFMTNPDLINQANAAAADIKQATAKLNSNDNSLGKGLSAFSKPITPLTGPEDKFQSISQGLQNGQGSAGKFFHDPAFQATTKSTWANASSLMDDVNAGKGGIGELAKDPTLGKSLSDTLAKTHTLLAGIDAGKGSAGKFMNDKTTSVDLKALQTESNDLVTKVRQNPKKYLTIQVRLF